jgi:hypothetical protein
VTSPVGTTAMRGMSMVCWTTISVVFATTADRFKCRRPGRHARQQVALQRLQSLRHFREDLLLHLGLQQCAAGRHQIAPDFVLADDIHHHARRLLLGLGGEHWAGGSWGGRSAGGAGHAALHGGHHGRAGQAKA